MKEDLTQFQVNEVVINDEKELVALHCYQFDNDTEATVKFNELANAGKYTGFARYNTIRFLSSLYGDINGESVRVEPYYSKITRANLHAANPNRFLVYVELQY